MASAGALLDLQRTSAGAIEDAGRDAGRRDAPVTLEELFVAMGGVANAALDRGPARRNRRKAAVFLALLMADVQVPRPLLEDPVQVLWASMGVALGLEFPLTV